MVVKGEALLEPAVPAEPGQALNPSLCPPALPFQASSWAGLPGVGGFCQGGTSRGVEFPFFLSAAQLEVFLWEGCRSQPWPQQEFCSSHPEQLPAGKVRLMDQESLSLAVLP